uniref:Chromosome 8 open reading frame 82 n=1 Tax=Macaca fascicularis TaxID=9541 RepID=A0A2K5UXT8_MACFA
MWSQCGALRSLRGWGVSYTQGQRPEPQTREYFYYVDHQGQLFLDDSKMKNFITCFKDPQFLVTFFSRLRPNRSGRYEAAFPFLSPCGRERNFLRCEDRPVVFTHLLTADHRPPRLSYCGGGEALAVPFEPALAAPGRQRRLYHPAPERAGGVGLVCSALAFELSACFEYGPGAPAALVLWQGRRLASPWTWPRCCSRLGP